MRFTAAELAVDLGGELHPCGDPHGGAAGPGGDGVAPGGDGDGAAEVVLEGVSIDSRTLVPGQLFVAVRGERDGHDFTDAAVAAGAPAVLVERPVPGVCSIVVPDAFRALLRIGGLARRRLPDRVVGITGSVGKTTTKDLLAAALGGTYRTAASERSFNNELGVPLTLANAEEGTEAAVVEMGARGHGHISLLCSVARPTVGVVTLVAPVHVEMMGGLDQIGVAKRELVESLPRDGAAVLNADDPLVSAMARHTLAEVVRYGTSGDVRAEDMSVDDELRPSFTLCSPWGDARVHLGARGAHNVTNALGAATAALWLGAPVQSVAEGLSAPVPSPWRMELGRTPSGAILLNDAYNASPTSMEAALRSLVSLPARRHIAVVGYMAELGADEAAGHRAVADLAADLGVELLAVGTDLYGIDPVPDAEAAVEQLGDVGDGDAVLVKASRVAGLEAVAKALTES